MEIVPLVLLLSVKKVLILYLLQNSKFGSPLFPEPSINKFLYRV